MKKTIIIITILLLAVIFVFMLIPKNLSVNSIVIPPKITEAFKNEIRSSVFSELSQKYAVTDTSDFWSRKFPEGTAEEILTDRANQKAIEYTIKLQLCIGEFDYNTILTAFRDENERLRQAQAKGEVIYGNTQYTLSSYLSYILAENERQYKSHYSFTDSELMDIYEKNKDNYKLDDIVTVKRVSFPFYAKGQFDENLYYTQKDMAHAFAVSPDFTNAAEHTFTYEDSKAFPNTYRYAMEIHEGTVSELICDEASFEIIYCTKRTPAGYMDFDTVKQSLIRIAENERFNFEVNNALTNAKISPH